MSQTVLLGDVVDISSSKRIFYSEYTNKGAPFYRSKEIIEKAAGNPVSTPLHISNERFIEISKKFGAPKAGDILLTSVGTLGIPYLVQEDDHFYFKDGNLTWFRKYSDRLHSKYLYYWLSSPAGKAELENHTIGSTQKALTIQGLKKVKIPLLLIEDQQKIVEILDSISGKIELNRRMNETLEQIGQTLFKHSFVDNPESKTWPTKELSEFLNVLESGSRPKGGAINEGVPSVGAENIDGLGIYDYSREKYISNEYFNNAKRGQVRSEDVLLYKDGAYVGKKSMFMDDFPHRICCVNEHVFRLRTNEKLPSQFYLYFWLDQEEITKMIKDAGIKAAQPGLNQESVKSLPILIPPVESVKNFDQTLRPILQKLFLNAKQMKGLSQLRDSLLPRLISGKIKI